MEMMGLEPIPFICKTNILPVKLHPLLDEVGFEPTSLKKPRLSKPPQ